MSLGRSPTKPMAWRMKNFFNGGNRLTAANPKSLANLSGRMLFENNLFRPSVMANIRVLSNRRQR